MACVSGYVTQMTKCTLKDTWDKLAPADIDSICAGKIPFAQSRFNGVDCHRTSQLYSFEATCCGEVISANGTVTTQIGHLLCREDPHCMPRPTQMGIAVLVGAFLAVVSCCVACCCCCRKRSAIASKSSTRETGMQLSMNTVRALHQDSRKSLLQQEAGGASPGGKGVPKDWNRPDPRKAPCWGVEKNALPADWKEKVNNLPSPDEETPVAPPPPAEAEETLVAPQPPVDAEEQKPPVEAVKRQEAPRESRKSRGGIALDPVAALVAKAGKASVRFSVPAVKLEQDAASGGMRLDASVHDGRTVDDTLLQDDVTDSISETLAKRKGTLHGDSLEEEIVSWLEEVSGETRGDLEFGTWLKDGQVLCRAANKVQPGIIKKINAQKMPFKQMENVTAFIGACRTLGVLEKDVFSTVDLYEEKNLHVVMLSIFNLASVIRTTATDFNGPYLGHAHNAKVEDHMRDRTLVDLRGGFRQDIDKEVKSGVQKGRGAGRDQG